MGNILPLENKLGSSVGLFSFTESGELNSQNYHFFNGFFKESFGTGI